MKNQTSKMAEGAWLAHSVLDCGDPPPLAQADKPSGADQSAKGLAHSKSWRSFVASLGFLVAAISTHAQSYSIDWSTIDGGGGTSTGGVFTVSGTIGQPDSSGPMTGGNFSLTGGFWSLYAVQTPGTPLLAITRTTTNTVAVFWPSPSTGFQLQVNTNNIGSGNWTNLVATPPDDGTTKTVILNPPTGNRFYRLWKP